MGRYSSSPYADLASAALHTGLEAEFTKEYASRMQIGREAPLKVLNRIGGGNALVRIEKGKKVMKERRGDWTNNDDLPVRPFVPLSTLNPFPSSQPLSLSPRTPRLRTQPHSHPGRRRRMSGLTLLCGAPGRDPPRT